MSGGKIIANQVEKKQIYENVFYTITHINGYFTGYVFYENTNNDGSIVVKYVKAKLSDNFEEVREECKKVARLVQLKVFLGIEE